MFKTLIVALDLGSDRVLAQDRTVDVVFVLDTTGSMSEEIAAMTATINKVAAVLAKDGVTVRLGLVEYKDRTDAPVTRATAAIDGGPVTATIMSLGDGYLALRAAFVVGFDTEHQTELHGFDSAGNEVVTSLVGLRLSR